MIQKEKERKIVKYMFQSVILLFVSYCAAISC